jgi:hypothetical protein
MFCVLRGAFDALQARMQLRAHEIRTGLTVIDAVAADDLNTQLLIGTGSPVLAQELRVMALELEKNGVTPNDLERLVVLRQRMRQPVHPALVRQLRKVASTLTSPRQVETLLYAADLVAALSPIPDHAVDNASRPWDPTDDTGHEHLYAPDHPRGERRPTLRSPQDVDPVHDKLRNAQPLTDKTPALAEGGEVDPTDDCD